MDPHKLRAEVADVLEFVARESGSYLGSLDDIPVRAENAERAAQNVVGPLPEEGEGALSTLQALFQDHRDGAIHSAGPRFFHFVTGGGTPAAVGAEMLASVIDQSAGLYDASPLAARLETTAVSWLLDLFDLPEDWAGVLTTGATMANFSALAAARRWWAQQHDVDVDDGGWAGLPAVPVFSSGYVHVSAVKALGMLGIGRSNVTTLARDDAGRLDEAALESALRSLDGAPSILIGNAGEVNTGDFDAIDRMADLAEKYGAWLHVDGAFGLFARLSPRSRDLTRGVERANSVIADGHKWLNVPYDCGFAFVRDRELLAGAFSASAVYLSGGDVDRPNFAFLGPEMSRRARSFAVWATLRAYGRAGYRATVERHLDLAQRAAQRVDGADDLERLADVPLNIVCFRYHPAGAPESILNDLNARLGRAVLEDGRVYVGTTTYQGMVAFRPAIVNWRTRESDVDLLVQVVRELGALLWAG